MSGSKVSRRNVEIATVEGRGRSGFAKRDFMPGDFVCEYSLVVREKVDSDWGNSEMKTWVLDAFALMPRTMAKCLRLMPHPR